ncbi:MAG: hypothetical protein NT135_00265 [Candidatus Berkelbacteria bacterium]|nr:hypothetical protein [Candidatus Berkelbacteria bacterium]
MDDIKTEIKETKVLDLEQSMLTIIAQFLVRAVAISLFLFLIFGGWLLAMKNTKSNLDSRVSEVDSELAKLKDLDDQVSVFNGAVTNIQSALSQKKKWPYIFKELNNIIPKDIVLSSFSVDEGNKVKIDASALGLTPLAKAIVAFNHDKENSSKENSVFKNVALTSFSFSQGKINFSLSADLSKGAK